MHSSWYRSSSRLPLITAYLSSKGRYMSKMLVTASWSPPLARRSICSNCHIRSPPRCSSSISEWTGNTPRRTLIRQSQLHADHIEWAPVQHMGKDTYRSRSSSCFKAYRSAPLSMFSQRGRRSITSCSSVWLTAQNTSVSISFSPYLQRALR